MEKMYKTYKINSNARQKASWGTALKLANKHVVTPVVKPIAKKVFNGLKNVWDNVFVNKNVKKINHRKKEIDARKRELENIEFDARANNRTNTTVSFNPKTNKYDVHYDGKGVTPMTAHYRETSNIDRYNRLANKMRLNDAKKAAQNVGNFVKREVTQPFKITRNLVTKPKKYLGLTPKLIKRDFKNHPISSSLDAAMTIGIPTAMMINDYFNPKNESNKKEVSRSKVTPNTRDSLNAINLKEVIITPNNFDTKNAGMKQIKAHDSIMTANNVSTISNNQNIVSTPNTVSTSNNTPVSTSNNQTKNNTNNRNKTVKRNKVKIKSVVKNPINSINNIDDADTNVDLKSVVKSVDKETPKYKYIIDKPTIDEYDKGFDPIIQAQLNEDIDNYIKSRKKKVLGGEDEIGMKKIPFEYTPLPKKPNLKIEQPKHIRPIYPIEYKTPIRNVFTDFYKNMTTDDKVSTASNVLGSIVSFGLNKASINKIKSPEKPISYKANRLKTDINVNPQIDNINEYQAAYERDIDNNSSSSNVALARKQNSRLNNRTAINSIYGNKYNTETELINKNRINQQEVDNNNIKEYNTWRNNVTNTNNSKNQMNAENNISLVANANAAIQDNISRQEQRKKDEQDRLATIAAYPNVNPRILKDLGVKVPYDVIMAWERNYRNKLNKTN